MVKTVGNTTGQANDLTVATGNGAVDGDTQRVTLATDSTGQVAVASLPASTNTLETVGDVAEDAALAGNPVRVGVRASAARPSSMSTDGDVVTPAADLSGQQYVIPGRCATATLANVSSSASSVTVVAANTSRKGVIIHNDSTAILYLKFGATASATSYTYKIAADGTWEMPVPLYTGIIDGIWAAANGNARTTELTA